LGVGVNGKDFVEVCSSVCGSSHIVRFKITDPYIDSTGICIYLQFPFWYRDCLHSITYKWR